MKKYKLIKDYPYAPCEVGIIWDCYDERYDLYPEFWQEVKEPLFVTEDGEKINGLDAFVFLVNEFVQYSGICEYYKLNERELKSYKIFSTKEAAEKWIEQNKPLFSKKQVLEAIEKLELSLTPNFCYVIDDTEFKKELGL